VDMLAVAPRVAGGAVATAPRTAACRAARLFRRADAQRNRPAARPAARHGEDATADRAAEAERDARPLEGLVVMTDWLGMAAHPRSQHPELKARVLGRALERRRWIVPLAAAAILVILAGGGSAYWASRTIRALRAERDTLSARLAALEDTVNTFIHGTATRLVQVPV